jgi:putative DNA primase/helicase
MTADLQQIVTDHGGRLNPGGRSALIPGPGHSRRDRSLSLMLSEDGERVIYHSFAGDSPGDILRHLKLEPCAARASSSADRKKEQARREHERRLQEAADRELCERIWAQTLPIEASPVEAYLWGRGLLGEGQPDLRFHPAAPLSKEPSCQVFQPAMIALVRAPDGTPKALHLTFIKPDGSGKAFKDRSRRMFGPVIQCAVRLGQIGRERVLAVGEGVETSASYAALKGVPAWAALSTEGLKNLRVPFGLKRLIIAADGDAPGLKAAQVLAERAQRVCDVEIHAAPEGADWNDVLSEVAA